jgi:hypothetical protein
MQTASLRRNPSGKHHVQVGRARGPRARDERAHPVRGTTMRAVKPDGRSLLPPRRDLTRLMHETASNNQVDIDLVFGEPIRVL